MPDLFETDTVAARATATLRPLTDVADVGRSWVELEKDSNCTFFQSWNWMGPWLEHFADRQNMYVFECRRGDVLIGLGVLGKGRIRRRLFFTSNQLVLNESTDASRNMLVEHNGLLSRHGEAEAVIEEFFRALSVLEEWEELRVEFGEHRVWAERGETRPGIESVVDWVRPSWVVPLTAATTVDGLVAGLSPNRRYQIRRTLKEFEKRGPLSITVAQDLPEAMTYFRSLRELHTRRWRMKGESGSFSHDGWRSFHEILIQNGFGAGTVQLLRIRCGTEDIGYIYNMLWRGRVLMLQTGFLRAANNLLRSGYVSHLLAMQLNAARGMTSYDFLPGSDDYKRIFAKPGPELVSVRFRRRSAKFQAEDMLVGLVRAFRGWAEFVRFRRSSIEGLILFSILSFGRALKVVTEMESVSPIFSM